MEDEATHSQDLDEVTIEIDEDDEDLIENTENIEEENESVIIDLRNKMAITYNVLKACIEEHSENVYYYMDYTLTRLAFLTNMKEDLLSLIVNKAKEPKKTDMLEESVLETPDIDFLIRETLLKYYVKYNKIPTSDSLNNITEDHCYNYQLHQQLYRSGYIWRRLPHTKRAIIVEHPKRVIERQRYLQKIMSHRKEKRCIVYIETKILNRADKDICHFQKYLTEAVNFIVMFIAVANDSKGFLNKHIFVSKSIFKCQKLIEDYIIKNIIPSLSEPSVIILEDKPYYSKSLPVPTIDSEKLEMIKWLKINGLLHDKKLHRSELFELIQRFKAKGDLHYFDAVLHAHGHEVLRRPSRTDYLNYYKPLWETLSLTEEVTIFVSKKSPEFWTNLETSIMKTENTVLNEDLEMENITDKILTMSSNIDVNEFADVECEEEEDSLAQEEHIIEHKNSFSSEELQEREWHFLYEIKKFERILQ